jgi:hypothetical protein
MFMRKQRGFFRGDLGRQDNFLFEKREQVLVLRL